MLLGLLLVLEIIVAIALTGVILLQRSEGGALGMGGGPGGFMTARGAGDLLTRTTAILATLFFALALLLTLVSGKLRGTGSIVDGIKVDALNPEALKQAPLIPPATDPNAAPPPAQAAPGVGAPAGPAAPSVFEAPRPQVNTAPGARPAAPPTTTRDSGATSPATNAFGVQTAPTAPQPAPKQ
jgi:preprotein translocase subunit SecG